MDVQHIIADAQEAIVAAPDLVALDRVRVQYLGKKGTLTDILKGLGNLSSTERPRVGQAVNEAKQIIQEAIAVRTQVLQKAARDAQLASEDIDVTLPGRRAMHGSLHPITLAMERITDIFRSMGFDVEGGPEIESEYYNFEALNMPACHPARAMQDTFYVEGDQLLRTHTSPVQIRYMQAHKPPLRMIAQGRVYRRDFDATHTPMFHQTEGLLIDEGVSLADLKSVLIEFLQHFFGQKLKTRFRPSYFPFTEPSAEVDMECFLCHGKEVECRICKGTGWLEVLGCGMVHPKVLEYGGVDSQKYTGYAFGLGIDRFALLYYRIKDLRTIFENDIRFLSQF